MLSVFSMLVRTKARRRWFSWRTGNVVWLIHWHMFLSSESWEEVNLLEWICVHCGRSGSEDPSAVC